MQGHQLQSLQSKGGLGLASQGAALSQPSAQSTEESWGAQD